MKKRGGKAFGKSNGKIFFVTNKTQNTIRGVLLAPGLFCALMQTRELPHPSKKRLEEMHFFHLNNWLNIIFLWAPLEKKARIFEIADLFGVTIKKITQEILENILPYANEKSATTIFKIAEEKSIKLDVSGAMRRAQNA